jgi:hypothetical protein
MHIFANVSRRTEKNTTVQVCAGTWTAHEIESPISFEPDQTLGCRSLLPGLIVRETREVVAGAHVGFGTPPLRRSVRQSTICERATFETREHSRVSDRPSHDLLISVVSGPNGGFLGVFRKGIGVGSCHSDKLGLTRRSAAGSGPGRRSSAP